MPYLVFSISWTFNGALDFRYIFVGHCRELVKDYMILMGLFSECIKQMADATGSGGRWKTPAAQIILISWVGFVAVFASAPVSVEATPPNC